MLTIYTLQCSAVHFWHSGIPSLEVHSSTSILCEGLSNATPLRPHAPLCRVSRPFLAAAVCA